MTEKLRNTVLVAAGLGLISGVVIPPDYDLSEFQLALALFALIVYTVLYFASRGGGTDV